VIEGLACEAVDDAPPSLESHDWIMPNDTILRYVLMMIELFGWRSESALPQRKAR
jgi:hypothetical protein